MFLNFLLMIFMCISFEPYISGMSESNYDVYVKKNKDLKKTLDDLAQFKHDKQKSGYGYKYANLQYLTDNINTIKLEKPLYKIAIPKFKGVPSHAVKNFCREHLTFNIDEEWAKVLDEQNDKSDKAQFSETFLNAREAFESNLKKAFEKVKNIETLDNLFKTQDLDNFIKSISESKEKIMVRSTGKEDTEESSNAGGNASVPNVTPTYQDVYNAIQIVVLSYFSEKSLSQRLGAGDLSVFEPIPFVPFLVQRMIGEKEIEGKSIPTKCGVMFTEEQEGAVSTKFRTPNKKGGFDVKENGIEKTGKIKTSSIALIQAAYGHNEAVVNSRIPVDTYYVDSGGIIFPIVRNKTQRMKPTAPGLVELIENEPQQAAEPALNVSALKTLNIVAKKLEQLYLRPMDIEFVVDEQEKTIYIVQARPLVPGKKEIQPSYFKNIGIINKNNKLLGTAIGVAGGALHIINDASEIIVAETINKGLDQYLNAKTDKNRVKVIIVGKMAPSTSHEATIFRSEQKAVLYIPEWTTAAAWIDKLEQNALVIDVQQGAIISLDEPGVDNSNKLIKENFVDGWFSYPIPRALTIKPFESKINFTINKRIINKKIKQITKLDTYENSAKAFFENTQKGSGINKPGFGVSFPKILASLKQGDRENARVALAVLFTNVSTLLKKLNQDITDDSSAQKLITWLHESAINCAYCLWNTLDFNIHHDLYTQRLFYIRILEALLYQQKLIDVRLAYSLTELFAILPKEKKIKEEKAIKDHYANQLIKLSSLVSLTKESAEKWEKFIIALDSKSEPEILKKLATMITSLAKLEALPAWLNIIFDQAVPDKEVYDPLEKTEQLLQSFDKDKVFITNLLEKKSELSAFNITAFDESTLFKKQWSLLKEHIAYFIGTFIEDFKNSNKLGKCAALSVMNIFVDTFDKSIKAVAGSRNYKLKKKLKYASTMVEHYAQIFLSWCTVEKNKEDQFQQKADSGINIDLLPLFNNEEGRLASFFEIFYTSYESIIKETKEKKISEENVATMLKPSPQFSVDAFTLGSGLKIRLTEVEQTAPKTLEDLFMWSHQNLLKVISFLGKTVFLEKRDIGELKFPPLLKKLHDEVMNQPFTVSSNGKDTKNPSFVTMQFEHENLILTYNLTLQNHSIQFNFLYDKNKKTIDCTIGFFGSARDRWDVITHALVFNHITKKFILKNLDSSKDHLKATMIVTETSNLDELYKNLNLFTHTTFILHNILGLGNPGIHKDWKKFYLCESNDIIALYQDLLLRDGLNCLPPNKEIFYSFITQTLNDQKLSENEKKLFIKTIFSVKKSDLIEAFYDYFKQDINTFNQHSTLINQTLRKHAQEAMKNKNYYHLGIARYNVLIKNNYEKSYLSALQAGKNLLNNETPRTADIGKNIVRLYSNLADKNKITLNDVFDVLMFVSTKPEISWQTKEPDIKNLSLKFKEIKNLQETFYNNDLVKEFLETDKLDEKACINAIEEAFNEKNTTKGTINTNLLRHRFTLEQVKNLYPNIFNVDSENELIIFDKITEKLVANMIYNDKQPLELDSSKWEKTRSLGEVYPHRKITFHNTTNFPVYFRWYFVDETDPNNKKFVAARMFEEELTEDNLATISDLKELQKLQDLKKENKDLTIFSIPSIPTCILKNDEASTLTPPPHQENSYLKNIPVIIFTIDKEDLKDEIPTNTITKDQKKIIYGGWSYFGALDFKGTWYNYFTHIRNNPIFVRSFEVSSLASGNSYMTKKIDYYIVSDPNIHQHAITVTGTQPKIVPMSYTNKPLEEQIKTAENRLKSAQTNLEKLKAESDLHLATTKQKSENFQQQLAKGRIIAAKMRYEAGQIAGNQKKAKRRKIRIKLEELKYKHTLTQDINIKKKLDEDIKKIELRISELEKLEKAQEEIKTISEIFEENKKILNEINKSEEKTRKFILRDSKKSSEIKTIIHLLSLLKLKLQSLLQQVVSLSNL